MNIKNMAAFADSALLAARPIAAHSHETANANSNRIPAAAIGLAAKSAEAANAATFLMFIAYASSAFVPVHTMPSWLRGFAANQPVTPVTEAVRALLLGYPAGGNLVPALAWTGGIAMVSAGAAAALFRRGTR